MISRRGFLSTLAGLVLGKVIGPRILPAPAPELWASIPALPPTPINSYVPIEAALADMARIIDEDIKFLKLARIHETGYGWRMAPGDTIQARKPYVFQPIPNEWDPDSIMASMTEQIGRVTLDGCARRELPLSSDLYDNRPFDHVSKYDIEPIAHDLAETIVRHVRHRGGADLLVSVDQEIPAGIERGVIVSLPEAGLSLRACQEFRPITLETRLRVDMLYGLG